MSVLEVEIIEIQQPKPNYRKEVVVITTDSEYEEDDERKKKGAINVHSDEVDSVIVISSSDEDDVNIKRIIKIEKRKSRRILRADSTSKKMRMLSQCEYADYGGSAIFSSSSAKKEKENVERRNYVRPSRELNSKRSYRDVFIQDKDEPVLKFIGEEKTDIKSRKFSSDGNNHVNIFDIMKALPNDILFKSSSKAQSTEDSLKTNDVASGVFDEAEVAHALSGYVMILDDPCIPIGEEVELSSQCVDDEIGDIHHEVVTQNVQCSLNFGVSTAAGDVQLFPDDESLDSDTADGTEVTVKSSKIVLEEPSRHSNNSLGHDSDWFPDDESLDSDAADSTEVTVKGSKMVLEEPSRHSNSSLGHDSDWFPDDESLDVSSVDGDETLENDEKVQQEPSQQLDSSSLLADASLDSDWLPATDCNSCVKPKPSAKIENLDNIRGRNHNSLKYVLPVQDSSNFSRVNNSATKIHMCEHARSRKNFFGHQRDFLQSPPKYIQPRPPLPKGRSVHVYCENFTALVEACVEESDKYSPLAITQIEAFTTASTRPSFYHVCCLMNWLVHPPNVTWLKRAHGVLTYVNQLHGMPPKLQLWQYLETAYLIDTCKPNPMGPLIKSTVFNFICRVLDTELAYFDESKDKFTLTHVYRLLSIDVSFGNVKTLVAWLEDTVKLYCEEGPTAVVGEDRGHTYAIIESMQKMLALCVQVSKVAHESVCRLGNELLKAYSRLSHPVQQRLLLETLQSDGIIVYVSEELLHRLGTPNLTVEELGTTSCSFNKIVNFYFEFEPSISSDASPACVVENFLFLLGLLQVVQISKLQGERIMEKPNNTSQSIPVKSNESTNVLGDYNAHLNKLQERLEQLCPDVSTSAAIQCQLLNLRMAMLIFN